MTEKTINVSFQQLADYRFEILFDEGMPTITSEEPAPLGKGTGPSTRTAALRSSRKLFERLAAICVSKVQANSRTHSLQSSSHRGAQ